MCVYCVYIFTVKLYIIIKIHSFLETFDNERKTLSDIQELWGLKFIQILDIIHLIEGLFSQPTEEAKTFSKENN